MPFMFKLVFQIQIRIRIRICIDFGRLDPDPGPGGEKRPAKIQGGSDKSGIFFFLLSNDTAQLKIIRFD
jgi:hypothetical protein